MPYTRFDPKGERPPEKSIIGDAQGPGAIVTFFQLLAIFAMLRMVMLVMGMQIIRIPYFDYYLVKLMRFVHLI